MLFSHKKSAQPVVRLQYNAQPETTYECLIYQQLVNRKALKLQTLVEVLADSMEREELARGAAVVDIGIWGSSICSRDALQLLYQLNGTLITITEES